MLNRNDERLKKNNFDLLRLLFAGTVCLVHSYELSGFDALAVFGQVLSSAVAVKAFFVVSGFLIFMSFERSASLGAYAEKRIRRIYPAYFMVVMICAFGLLVVSSKGIEEYFSSTWVKYVLANLVFLNFLQPTLPGVFESHRIAVVDGALWTLKIEVMFYLMVPVLGHFFLKFGRLSVLLSVYGLSVAYAWIMSTLANRTGSSGYSELARQLPGQLSYFIAGAVIYYYLPTFERRVGLWLAAAVAILAVNKFFPLSVFEPFAIATIVAFFGLFVYVGNFGKYGDFSYGVYILHFPIIQLVLHLGLFNKNPWQFLVAVVVLTMSGAVMTWHLVEKRFLFRSSHYVISSELTPLAPTKQALP